MNLPPCIKAAASMRDMDALDDILSFFHTFGEDGLEPTLWSLGYFTLDNYESRKNSALGMVKTSKPLLCFVEKSSQLKKYCSDECPLKYPDGWLNNAVKQVYLISGMLPTSRRMVIEFHGGEIFKSDDYVFLFYNPNPFLENVAKQFKQWFKGTFDVELPLTVDELRDMFSRWLWGDAGDDTGAPMR